MRRLAAIDREVTIELDGRPVQAREGEPVAASLVAAGELLFSRSAKYHRPRGPFCFSGECGQCAMRVDGVPNTCTCAIEAREGLALERQNALPSARVDFLRATDFAFPKFFNHHEFLAGVPLAEAAMRRVARRLSGLGRLPSADAAPAPDARELSVDMAIVGGGVAGVAAARRLAAAGAPFALFERREALGGRARYEVDGATDSVPVLPDGAAHLRSPVVGLYADGNTPSLVVRAPEGLLVVRARRLLLALGGHAAYVPFPNADLPGTLAGRAVAELIRVHGILPGATIACVGDPSSAEALAALVEARGGRAVAVGARPLRAHGLSRVERLTFEGPAGPQRVACDLVAVCGPPTPAFEFAHAAGAAVSWSDALGAFVVEADASGRTSVPALYVAGDVRGARSLAQAADDGRRAAEAMLADGSAP